MSDLTRALLDDLLPPGPLWGPEEQADFDLLLDGIGDNYEVVRLFLSALSDIRNPNTTMILDDLEREYGIPTNTLLSEATRRQRLVELVFGTAGNGTEDDLQTALRNVGFDVYVYQNDPAVDPAIFLDQQFQMVAGAGNAYAGRSDAFAARIGGELLVNGEIFLTSRIFTSGAGSGFYAGTGHGAGEYTDLLVEKQEYPVPTDHDDWPLVFFVGGAATYGFNLKSFSVGSEDANPQGIFFKPDGTKMYMIGTGGDAVDQYSLSVPWDIDTAVDDGVTFSVAGQETAPQAIFFKPDGTKMYIVGVVSDDVHQYSLAAPWDITTPPTYDGSGFSVAPEDTIPTGLFFRPDGTKMYIVGNNNDKVYQYSLSVAWDITTPPTYDGISFPLQDTNAQNVFFKPDGSVMYIVGITGLAVYQHSLTSPWDIGTAGYDEINFSLAGQNVNPKDVFFKPDGTLMYVLGGNTLDVDKYTLQGAWDLNDTEYLNSIDMATVDGAREDEFKRIILSYKPLHSWAALIVNFA